MRKVGLISQLTNVASKKINTLNNLLATASTKPAENPLQHLVHTLLMIPLHLQHESEFHTLLLEEINVVCGKVKQKLKGKIH